MMIELLKDAVVTQATSKTNKVYQQAELVYKNLNDGKVASRKVMSFDGAFKVLSTGKEGEQYNVTSEKKGDFWNWTEASKAVEGAPQENKVGASPRSTPAPRSNYETPEERARRQVYICRQSSLERALDFMIHNKGKDKVTIEEVINTAQQFTIYVMDTDLNPFSDMEDDVI